jgi:hypothetical protein
MKHSDYNTLGRTIATSSKFIGHTSDNCHFVRVNPPSALYREMYIEEFLQKVKSKLLFPAILWEAYDNGYDDNRGDQISKIYKPAFIILLKVTPIDDFTAQENAQQEAELIAEEILSYLKKYFADNLTYGFFMINTINIEKVGPVDNNLWGVRCEWAFKKPNNQALYFKPENWS